MQKKQKEKSKTMKALFKRLNKLKILYSDLNWLIVQYAVKKWESSAFKSWSTSGITFGITNFQQNLYICHRFSKRPNSQIVSIYNQQGEILGQNDRLKEPFGIDIDKNTSLVYVACHSHVTILNLKLQIIRSWELPVMSLTYSDRGLKVDESSTIYLTIYEVHQIFVCNTEGKVLKKWGNTIGFATGEYNHPTGITVNKKMFIYAPVIIIVFKS